MPSRVPLQPRGFARRPGLGFCRCIGGPLEVAQLVWIIRHHPAPFSTRKLVVVKIRQPGDFSLRRWRFFRRKKSFVLQRRRRNRIFKRVQKNCRALRARDFFSPHPRARTNCSTRPDAAWLRLSLFHYGSALLQFDATGDRRYLDMGRGQTIAVMAPHVTQAPGSLRSRVQQRQHVWQFVAADE